MSRHLLQSILTPILPPFAKLYGQAMSWRRRAYKYGRMASAVLPAPCISVGNISWGGTGKTPVVDWLLAWAEQRGLQAAVLTRGYGSHPPHLPFRVEAKFAPAQTGDEALLLKIRHPAATVIVDPKRSRAARLSPSPDLFILDDGFQHLAVRRDLDLVLVDKNDLGGQSASNWNKVIPAGTWREPVEALAAASAFLIKIEPGELDSCKPFVGRNLPGKPVFFFYLCPQGLLSREHFYQGRQEYVSPRDLSGPYAILSGLGNPAQFRRTVEIYMRRPAGRVLTFPDHHDFTRSVHSLKQIGLPIICSEKDMVKLVPHAIPRLYALAVIPEFFSQSGVECGFAGWFADWWDLGWQGNVSV